MDFGKANLASGWQVVLWFRWLFPFETSAGNILPPPRQRGLESYFAINMLLEACSVGDIARTGTRLMPARVQRSTVVLFLELTFMQGDFPATTQIVASSQAPPT